MFEMRKNEKSTNEIKIGRGTEDTKDFSCYLSIMDHLFNFDAADYRFALGDEVNGAEDAPDAVTVKTVMNKISERKQEIIAYLAGENEEFITAFAQAQGMERGDVTDLCGHIVKTNLLDGIKMVKYSDCTRLYLPQIHLDAKDVDNQEDTCTETESSSDSQSNGSQAEDIQNSSGPPEEEKASFCPGLGSIGEKKGPVETGEKKHGRLIKILIVMTVFLILIVLLYSFITKEKDVVISYQPHIPNYKEMGVVSPISLPPVEGQQKTNPPNTGRKLVKPGDNGSSPTIVRGVRGGEYSLPVSFPDDVAKKVEDPNPKSEPVNKSNEDNEKKTEKPNWFTEDKLSYKIQILLPSGTDASVAEAFELTIDNSDGMITQNFNSYVIDFGNNNPDKYTIKCIADGKLICNIVGNDDVINACMNEDVKVLYGYGFAMPKGISQENWPNVQWEPKGNYENYRESMDTTQGTTQGITQGITRKNCYWQIDNSISQTGLGLLLRHEPTDAVLKVNSKSIKSGNLNH